MTVKILTRDIHEIHGFNTDGDWIKEADDVAISLGYKSFPFYYGKNRTGIFRDLLWTRWTAKRDAKAFARHCHNGAIAVAHSNGTRLVGKAMYEHQAPLAGAIYMGAALNRDYPLPPMSDAPHLRVVVFYSKHDVPVKVAAWIPFSEWGDMGARGPAPGDPRYIPIDVSDLVGEHSEYVNDMNIYRHLLSIGLRIIEGSPEAAEYRREYCSTGV